MSNHSGSHMLNEVLRIFLDLKISENIGEARTREFAKRLVELGDGYDCNPGEILEGLDKEIGICYFCLNESNDLQDGLCPSCR
ncbi:MULTISPECIES: hypothetical protein [Kyrpidia]|uniref:Uncharacterized protein n=3 Tax=Kyrpidia TaxID=1129704 RepID=A0ACA8Z4Z3_9BACL|nr:MULTISPECIES: hypothetical protein [Kyrpidia]ADG05611.1 conserved hypothetical protein [Kyrpidia tusciae DSM 2912]CAB3389550.1 conserved protein of unknown function [Kyrpidia spormannii]CAB3390390.1 conserved protein of unknown function [Kyrpidia spormannii]